MLRAHMEGLIDYASCDPDDTWWWIRHDAIIEALAANISREIWAKHHEHHVTLASGFLKPEAFERISQQASVALNRWWKLQTPWDAEQIGDIGTVAQDEQLAKDYRELVGEPGTPKHAEIMAELARELKPVSRAEQLRRRRIRQAQEKIRRLEEEAAHLQSLAAGGAA